MIRRDLIFALSALGLLFAVTADVHAAEIIERGDLERKVAELSLVYGRHLIEFGARHEGPERITYDYPSFRVIELSGQIVPGDAERLSMALKREPGEFGAWRQPTFVVLDSPGGDFQEGLRIGRLLGAGRGGNGIPALGGVLVERDGECLSACAVAFTMAALKRDVGQSVRYIEVGGRVGFHMPAIPENRSLPATPLEWALDFSYDVVAEYLAVVSDGIAPVALFENAVRYNGADSFFVLRGGLLSRYMDFVPVARGPLVAPIDIGGVTLGQAIALCQYWTYSTDQTLNEGDYEFWPLDISPALPHETPLTQFFEEIGSQRIAHEYCGLEWRADDTLGISLFVDVESRCEDDNDRRSAHNWCPSSHERFTPVTAGMLADALDCHSGELTEHSYSLVPPFLEEETDGSEANPAPVNWSRRTLANVNLRTTPGTGSDLVTLIPEDTQVTVTSCAILADGQGVWFEITSNAGMGWVSGRYVSHEQRKSWTEFDNAIRPAGIE